MKHIVSEKDDEKFLKEYKIKMPAKRNKSVLKERSERSQIMIKELKSRIREIEKTEQSSSNNMEETRPYLYLPSSKKN